MPTFVSVTCVDTTVQSIQLKPELLIECTLQEPVLENMVSNFSGSVTYYTGTCC